MTIEQRLPKLEEPDLSGGSGTSSGSVNPAFAKGGIPPEPSSD